MAQREEAKEQNRARIRAAAEAIIRAEGMDRLTMRYLAEQADVSLRTPYNLFGSKTDVLIALLDQTQFDPLGKMSSKAPNSVLEALLAMLDRFERFLARDEDFYRVVFREIIASDQRESRVAAVNRTLTIGETYVEQAKAKGELHSHTDVHMLGSDLAYQLLTMLGMWSKGIYSIKQGIARVRRGWCAMLLAHASDEVRPAIEKTHAKALKQGH